MDLNKVMLIGRLSQDPELRNLPSGKSIVSFSVATARQWTDKAGVRQKQAEFQRIVAWGKLAEIVSQYLHKGSQVYVEGRLQTHDWMGEDKVKHYRTEVVAEELIMLGSKPANGNAPATPRGSANHSSPDRPEEVIEEEVKVESLPF